MLRSDSVVFFALFPPLSSPTLTLLHNLSRLSKSDDGIALSATRVVALIRVLYLTAGRLRVRGALLDICIV